MADSARHSVYYDSETSYGATDSSPAFTHLRHTSCTLGLSKETNISEELNSHAQIVDSRHGNKTAGGDIGAELSYNSQNDIFEALLGGTWTTSAVTVTGTTISATASGNTIDDSGSGFGSFAVGDMVEISGFTGETGNNGIARVTAASSASLTLDGLTLADDAAGESVTVEVLDQLKTGTTRRSFSIMRDFADLTDGRYQLYTGCEFNTAEITLGLGTIITTSFGVIGSGHTSSASAPASSTFGNATTTKPFVSYDGSIREAGGVSTIMSGLTISLDNGLEPKFHLGSSTTAGQAGRGRTNITGSVTAYFDDDTMLNKFLNETESSIQSTVIDAAGNTFVIFLPRVVYNAGQPDVGGEANTTLSLDFQALYDDTTSDATMIIAKLDA